MVDAIQVFARYDLPCELFPSDEVGEYLTRREKYVHMGDEIEQPPELEIPDDGQYLWRLFAEIDMAVTRIADGACSPIPPSEWVAWLQLTAHDISFEEWEILHAMDVAFCIERNKDFAAVRAERERKQQETTPRRQR